MNASSLLKTPCINTIFLESMMGECGLHSSWPGWGLMANFVYTVLNFCNAIFKPEGWGAILALLFRTVM
jgi:hypothetical protein